MVKLRKNLMIYFFTDKNVKHIRQKGVLPANACALNINQAERPPA